MFTSPLWLCSPPGKCDCVAPWLPNVWRHRAHHVRWWETPRRIRVSGTVCNASVKKKKNLPKERSFLEQKQGWRFHHGEILDHRPRELHPHQLYSQGDAQVRNCSWEWMRHTVCVGELYLRRDKPLERSVCSPLTHLASASCTFSPTQQAQIFF